MLAIEPGTYVLTAMINVSAPIVLRGAGLDATTLFFPKPLSEVQRRGPATSDAWRPGLARHESTSMYRMGIVWWFSRWSLRAWAPVAVNQCWRIFRIVILLAITLRILHTTSECSTVRAQDTYSAGHCDDAFGTPPLSAA